MLDILYCWHYTQSLDWCVAFVLSTETQRYFNVSFFIVVIGSLAWVTSKQVIRSNKIQEEEKTKLHKRITDLQLSALQSQMNPHFIFNALGSIQYFIQTFDTVKADEFLTRFALLMRSILESSKKKYITLSEEIHQLQLFISLEKVRFENKFDYTIEIDERLDQEYKIPPMIIQPFIENAIGHGLYHLKDRKGTLHIEINAINDSDIEVIVLDNGIGRKAAASLRNKNHKSRGLQIVHERIDTINAMNELHIGAQTEDLWNNEIPAGTKVSIIVSMGKETS